MEKNCLIMRKRLAVGMGMGVLLLSLMVKELAGGVSHSDDVLFGGKFKVEIDGVPMEADKIQSLSVEDLTIDVREVTCGVDWDFRCYEPGDVHFGDIRIMTSSERDYGKLYAWVKEWSEGNGIRKNISVAMATIADPRPPVVTLTFEKCWPVRWEGPELDCLGEGSAALTVRPMQVSLESSDGGKDAVGRVKDTPLELECDERAVPVPLAQQFYHSGLPYAVRITDVETGETSQWSGFSSFTPQLPVIFELDESGVLTPGYGYVNEITLRGPITPDRKAICGWINETINGRRWRVDMTVVELQKDGREEKRFVYYDCFPTGYVFPRMSTSGTGNLYEEIHLKPIRMELK